MRRSLVALIGVAVPWVLVLAPPAHAMTVKHQTSSFDDTIKWSCPGPDPVEHYTLTAKTTTFSVDGHRVRVIVHTTWRGWITHRDTGALIRDYGNWTDVYRYRGNHLLRAVTTGSIWRLTIPGQGIVVHQTGRSVFDPDEGEQATPFGGQADPSAMCPYV